MYIYIYISPSLSLTASSSSILREIVRNVRSAAWFSAICFVELPCIAIRQCLLNDDAVQCQTKMQKETAVTTKSLHDTLIWRHNLQHDATHYIAQAEVSCQNTFMYCVANIVGAEFWEAGERRRSSFSESGKLLNGPLLNCPSCRSAHDRPHSMHAWHWFSEKALFFTEFCFIASPSPKSIPILSHCNWANGVKGRWIRLILSFLERTLPFRPGLSTPCTLRQNICFQGIWTRS